MARVFLLAIAAAAVLAVGCGDSDNDDSNATTSGDGAAQTTGAGEAMKEDGEAMKKDGEADGDAMKSDGDAMKSDGDAMKSDGEADGDAMKKEYDGSKSQGAAMQSRQGAGAEASMVANRKRKRGRVVRVVRSQFGPVVADRRGEAVYLFDKEKGKRSRCYGACAKAWPPLLTRGRPRARNGARARLLGVTRRKGGALQVTYRGHPLYYYKDDRPGLILCQDVAEFGGLWLVVKPNGTPVT